MFAGKTTQVSTYAFLRGPVMAAALVTTGVTTGMLVPANAEAGYRIASVRIGDHIDKTRVVFDLQGQGRYSIRKIGPSNHRPYHRIVITYPAGQGRIPSIVGGKGLVKAIRFGRQRNGARTAVVDLKQDARYTVRLIPGRNGYGKRLVLDIFRNAVPARVQPSVFKRESGYDAAPSATPANDEHLLEDYDDLNAFKGELAPPAKGVQVNVLSQNRAQKKKPADRTLARKRPSKSIHHAYKRPRLSSTIVSSSILSSREKRRLREEIRRLTRRPLDDNRIIVAIDAGHGGRDKGAVRNGVVEKRVTLKMAYELKRWIDSQKNMKAILVRKNDKLIPLTYRPEIARRHNADLFVSLHANSYPRSSRVRGASIYVHSYAPSSYLAGLVAKSENGVVKLKHKYGKAKRVAYVLDRATHGANVRASRKLARSVLNEMGRVTKLHSKRVHSADYVVLRHAKMPAILIEMGFLTNRYDARNLNSRTFRKKLARAIGRGIVKFAKARAHLPNWGEELYAEYQVRRGDTLAKVAQRFGTSVSRLKRLNKLRSLRLRAGQTLKVPLPMRTS